LDAPHVDEDERFRCKARAAFVTALATFAVAGSVAVVDSPSAATGLAWLAGGSLLLGVIYSVMYRV
jgi:hypothetical protein